jgi:hypothetical protein
VYPEAFAHTKSGLPPKPSAIRAALDAAIAHASAEFPSLRLRPDEIDYATVETFVRDFSIQLQEQVLDVKASPAKPTKAKPMKAKKSGSPEPDWGAMADAIVACGARAARAYAKKHGAASALILDTDPPSSYVLFSFESASGLLASASSHCRNEATRRAKALTGKGAWKLAEAYLRPRIDEALNPGDFAAMDFDRVDFGEAMATFADDSRCPKSPAGVEPYVNARFRMVLAAALDRLVAERTLDPLIGSAPLLVGYTFHEEPSVVLHVLTKLPEAQTRSKRRSRG